MVLVPLGWGTITTFQLVIGVYKLRNKMVEGRLLSCSSCCDRTVAKQITWQEAVTWPVQVRRSLVHWVRFGVEILCFSCSGSRAAALSCCKEEGPAPREELTKRGACLFFFFFASVAHLEFGRMNIRCLPADSDSPEKCKHRGPLTCGRVTSADVFCSCSDCRCASAFQGRSVQSPEKRASLGHFQLIFPHKQQ